MSEKAIRQFPEDIPMLQQVKSLSESETQRQLTYEQEIKAFYERMTLKDKGLQNGFAVWAQPGFDDSEWKRIMLPRMVQELWPGINGIYWFRKEIDIPASWAGKSITLSLGPIDDFDETYWNGQQAGSGTKAGNIQSRRIW